MDWTLYGSFIAASLLLAIAPGPDILFVLVQSAACGRRVALWVVLGLMAGLVLQTFAAAMGVAAVVAASPVLFWSVRVAGALYLIYLAWGSWRAGTSGTSNVVHESRPSRLIGRGFVMNVTNPKVQIFFLAFFPQFLATGLDAYPVMLQMVILGVTFMLSAALVMGSVAIFAGTLSDYMRSAKVQYVMNRVSAVIFVCLAIATLVGL